VLLTGSHQVKNTRAYDQLNFDRISEGVDHETLGRSGGSVSGDWTYRRCTITPRRGRGNACKAAEFHAGLGERHLCFMGSRLRPVVAVHRTSMNLSMLTPSATREHLASKGRRIYKSLPAHITALTLVSPP